MVGIIDRAALGVRSLRRTRLLVNLIIEVGKGEFARAGQPS